MQNYVPISMNTVDALIVVDVQNAFVSGPEAVPGHKMLISAIELLLTQARLANAPVIFLQNDGPVGATDEPFQPGWALFFPPRPHEKIVRKKNDNGFDGTDLHTILTGLGIRTVAMCGMLSDMCLAATARAAMEHGYGVLLPHDAHATYDVPAGPGSEAVPAAMAARAAEWSLGDEIKICAASHEVRFVAARSDAPAIF
ncbi:isochorismatase family protein [Escherichia coli]|nr:MULTISPECIES: isochorismatase family protein [Gammaproteobacteria]EIN5730452.1 isochorismatase family protein [Salmonella enterica subsp. enterica serovar Worthington]EHR0314677.1 isochorismatase family protein [Escherichia coli]EHR8752886.1 isochorismatase family protein [Escherichia coli]EHZ9680891.1 isochorismatase family protein [Escherichia coli]EIF0933786.1 isochorismatase family protein [Escherichia coli]